MKFSKFLRKLEKILKLYMLTSCIRIKYYISTIYKKEVVFLENCLYFCNTLCLKLNLLKGLLPSFGGVEEASN